MCKLIKKGLGLVLLVNIVFAAWLRRNTLLISNTLHPISHLQSKLGAHDHLGDQPVLHIDDITTRCMSELNRHHLSSYSEITRLMAVGDGILKLQLLHSHLKWLTCPNKHGSIESTMILLTLLYIQWLQRTYMILHISNGYKA
jgi:hypothetical protein